MTWTKTTRRGVLAGGIAATAQLATSRSGRPQEFVQRILIPDTPFFSLASSMVDEMRERTGAPIEFDPYPPESIEFALREDARTGAHSIQGAIVPMWNIGGYLVDDIIRPLDDLIASAGNALDEVDLAAELPAVRHLRTFGSEQVALPIDGDCQLLYFQRDVLQSDEFVNSFAAETGSVLAVPEQWDDLLGIAEWWNARGGQGIALNLAPAGAGVMPFLSMAASYATDASPQGEFWFDGATFEPRIASTGHVAALNDFLQLANTGLADQSSWYLPDAWNAFLNGEALFTIAGPDLLTAAIDWKHPRQSLIGVARLPGAPSTIGTPSPEIAAGSFAGNALGPCWGGVVRSTAQRPEETLSVLSMFSASVFQQDRGWTVDDGIDPARLLQLPGTSAEDETSTLEQYVDAGFSSEQADEFARAIVETLSAEIQLPYLRIPGAVDYLTALERRIVAYVNGDISDAEEALTLAAEDFAALSIVHGEERQHELYQLSIMHDDL